MSKINFLAYRSCIGSYEAAALGCSCACRALERDQRRINVGCKGEEIGPHFLSLFNRAPFGTNNVLIPPDNVSPAAMDLGLSASNAPSFSMI
jgi:hypothetical protein